MGLNERLRALETALPEPSETPQYWQPEQFPPAVLTYLLAASNGWTGSVEALEKARPVVASVRERLGYCHPDDDQAEMLRSIQGWVLREAYHRLSWALAAEWRDRHEPGLSVKMDRRIAERASMAMLLFDHDAMDRAWFDFSGTLWVNQWRAHGTHDAHLLELMGFGPDELALLIAEAGP